MVRASAKKGTGYSIVSWSMKLKMNKKRWPLVLIALVALLFAFLGSGDFIEKQYKGKYNIGFEVNTFHPCGSNQRWWVEADSTTNFIAALSAFKPPEEIFKVTSIYVEWRGRKSFFGFYGHLGHSHRKIEVSKIEEAKAYVNDCEHAGE